MMGVDWQDSFMVAKLIGYKTFFNEFVAYQQLSKLIHLRPSGWTQICGWCAAIYVGGSTFPSQYTSTHTYIHQIAAGASVYQVPCQVFRVHQEKKTGRNLWLHDRGYIELITGGYACAHECMWLCVKRNTANLYHCDHLLLSHYQCKSAELGL